MTVTQLESLLKANPKLMTEHTALLKSLILKKIGYIFNKEEFLASHEHDFNDHLMQAIYFLNTFKLPVTEVLVNALYRIIFIIKYEKGEFSDTVFRHYLERPLFILQERSIFKNEYYNEQKHHADLLLNDPYMSEFYRLIYDGYQMSDRKLITAYLKDYFKTHTDKSEYQKVFTDKFLNDIYYKTRLHAGEKLEKINEI